MDRKTLSAIVVDGHAETTVSAADELGNQLARLVSTSQIRNIFGTVRRIEMNWPAPAADQAGQAAAQQAHRELQLLKPKMAYQARREGGRGVQVLTDVLTDAIDLVGNDRQRFQHFVDFFEAILAYHKAYGGR